MLKKLVNLAILLIVLFSMNSVAIAANHVMFNISQEVLVFTDMHGHWAQETVNWAVEKGVVTGYKDGTFKPNNQVTESEFLAMLIRAYMPDLNAIPGAHWAEHYYILAKENNYPIGTDARSTVITRGYVAELVSATQGVNYVGDNAIQYLLGEGLSKGSDPSKVTIESYNAKGKLTRAEAVQFIKNLIEKGKQELEARPNKPSDVNELPTLPSGGAQMIGNVEVKLENGQPSVIIPVKDAREISIEVIKTIRVEDNKVYFTGPKLPKGYKLQFSVYDQEKFKEGKVTILFNEYLVTSKNYEVEFYTKGAFIYTSITADGMNHGNNIDSFRIELPSLELSSAFTGW